ncbi:hypothetical protein DFH06DRAFT_1327588 [Mycena polygramma]|nr:hypothetical protein DFH06DRAFT_1327588 [Mycena polygramma]
MASCNVHPLNSDISGIGVRISFYLQTLFLGCLSVRSSVVEEISGALYTLMATNTAMAITGLILGLKPEPEITFQDAVIIVYLLSMGWVTVLASLAACNRLADETKILQWVSVIQGYVILAFAFAILATAPSFGQNPQCNGDAVAVILRPFSALKHGRVLGWCIVSLVSFGYTGMVVWDLTRPLRKPKGDPPPPPVEVEPPQSSAPVREPGPALNFVDDPLGADTAAPKRPDSTYGPTAPLVDHTLLVMLFSILVIWVFFVLNIELVIHWYQPTSDDSASNWQFGQILALFLPLLPFIQMSSVFKQFGFRPTKMKMKLMPRPDINDNDYDTEQNIKE